MCMCPCGMQTCPTCGGSGVVPGYYSYPWRPMWPWRMPLPRPRPILVIEQPPRVPGFDRSRGALRDRIVAVG